jgi:hypothetical protein
MILLNYSYITAKNHNPKSIYHDRQFTDFNKRQCLGNPDPVRDKPVFSNNSYWADLFQVFEKREISVYIFPDWNYSLLRKLYNEKS